MNHIDRRRIRRFSCTLKMSGTLSANPFSESFLIEEKIPNSVENILEEMEKSIEAKCYHAALIVALTIPEVCMALSLPKSKFVNQTHYKKFVDEYTNRENLGIDSEICYQIRGGLVHRADLAGHAYIDYDQIIFTLPNTRLTLHACIVEVGQSKALALDLEIFCRAMKTAALKWHEQNSTGKDVKLNMMKLLRLYPNGMRPIATGIPLLASGAFNPRVVDWVRDQED